MVQQDESSRADLAEPYLIIDPARLQDDTLTQLAKEFVLREQANDGANDYDLELAVSRAVVRIKRGEFLITFDSETESVGVIDRRDPSFLKSQVGSIP